MGQVASPLWATWPILGYWLSGGKNRWSCCHHRIVKQQLELVAQARGTSNAPVILRRIVARQQDIINGSDLCPYLVMSSKEGDLLGVHTIIAHEGRGYTSANLHKDVLARA